MLHWRGVFPFRSGGEVGTKVGLRPSQPWIHGGPFTRSRPTIATLTSMAKHPPGPPMTLANMRALGVRGLDVLCWICRHQVRLDVDAYDDDTPAPWFGPRMVCTQCGIIGADARPNWKEQPPRPTKLRYD